MYKVIVERAGKEQALSVRENSLDAKLELEKHIRSLRQGSGTISEEDDKKKKKAS